MKLRNLTAAIRAKQADLSQALAYTNVLQMENRVKELEKSEAGYTKQILMLDKIKNKQVKHLQNEETREEKNME